MILGRIWNHLLIEKHFRLVQEEEKEDLEC